jgi:hypothetical protein
LLEFLHPWKAFNTNARGDEILSATAAYAQRCGGRKILGLRNACFPVVRGLDVTEGFLWNPDCFSG